MVTLPQESSPQVSRSTYSLALSLVSRVLDEACVFTRVAMDSDEFSIWNAEKVNDKANPQDDALTDEISHGSANSFDNNNINNINKVGGNGLTENHIVDSDCSKNKPVRYSQIDNIIPRMTEGADHDEDDKELEQKKLETEINYIGQGDEECLIAQIEQIEETFSQYRRVLGMNSDDQTIPSENVTILHDVSDNDNLITSALSRIMESYLDPSFVDLPFNFERPTDPIDRTNNNENKTDEYSDYTFLADIFGSDINRNVVFFNHYDGTSIGDTRIVEIEDVTDMEKGDGINQTDKEEEEEKYKAEDRQELYNMDAYLTLNRDEDICTDNETLAPESETYLTDDRSLPMQEIELKKSYISETQQSDNPKIKQDEGDVEKEMKADETNTSRPAKKSLVKRCRSHGARLLFWLRGWWRKSTPGYRRSRRGPGSYRGCPLSPDARRRATSLLDDKFMSPASCTRRKFNTVNEVMVTKSSWNDYTFVKGDTQGCND